MVNRHALTDEQWSRVYLRLPQSRGPRSEQNDRRFVEAVVWIARTGVPWRDLDRQFGAWKSVYNRFRNWARRGWWVEVFRGHDIEEEIASIMDASVVRAHQDAAAGAVRKQTRSGAPAEDSRRSSMLSLPSTVDPSSCALPLANVTRRRSPRTCWTLSAAATASPTVATMPTVSSKRPSSAI